MARLKHEAGAGEHLNTYHLGSVGWGWGATGTENEQGTGLDLSPGCVTYHQQGKGRFWVSHLNPLNLIFLICKMGIVAISCSSSKDNVKGQLRMSFSGT